MGAEVQADVRRGRRPLAEAARGRSVDRAEYRFAPTASRLAYARRAFGAVPVQKLTPAALADWSATLTGKDGQALAPATKRRAIVRLKSVMAHARGCGG